MWVSRGVVVLITVIAVIVAIAGMLVPGFVLSFATIVIVSLCTKARSQAGLYFHFWFIQIK